jgi:hypothetical protein
LLDGALWFQPWLEKCKIVRRDCVSIALTQMQAKRGDPAGGEQRGHR